MEEIKIFAPVLIPTLNRHEHFKRCVESLVACTYADKTDLFIALDYPLNNSHKYGYNVIKSYISSIRGFKSINIFERETNYGARKNILDARKIIFEKYDRLILSEDDNIFSPDFLYFVNKGLEVYKDRKDIFSVTGYQYPIKLPKRYKHDIYLYHGFSAWGYGVWRDRFEKLTWNIEEIQLFLRNKEQGEKIMSKNLISKLKKIVETGNITGDVYICYYQIVNNMHSVFPVTSRVINTGFDGSGIHGGNSKWAQKKYLNQKKSDGTLTLYFPYDILPDKTVIKYLRRQLKSNIIKELIRNPDIVSKKVSNVVKHIKKTLLPQ